MKTRFRLYLNCPDGRRLWMTKSGWSIHAWAARRLTAEQGQDWASFFKDHGHDVQLVEAGQANADT